MGGVNVSTGPHEAAFRATPRDFVGDSLLGLLLPNPFVKDH